MKRILSLVVVLLLLVPASMGAAEEEKVLNIFTWAEYIDRDTILSKFEEETGIRVDYSFFNSNEEMLTKLQSVGGGTYDIILASDYIIDVAREEGLMLPLDTEKLPNLKNIDPTFQSQFYDPENKYTVPYVAGTPLILYDPALVDIEITGYESLWDESLADSIVLIDDARNIIGITLKTLGQSFNTTDEEILRAAEEKLMQLKKNVRVLDYDRPDRAIVSGEASIGYMFTPGVLWALEDRPDLEVVYPKEGMGFGIDNLFIPVNAPHPENAHLFLDFIMRPEIAVNIAELQGYINCNAAADALLSDAFKQNPVLYIPSEVLGQTEFIENVGDAQLIYNDIWTRFKQY